MQPFGMVRRAAIERRAPPPPPPPRAVQLPPLAAPAFPPAGKPTPARLPGPALPQQPQIILLKEGTDTSQGKPQLISNINACYAVADVVRCWLGSHAARKRALTAWW